MLLYVWVCTVAVAMGMLDCAWASGYERNTSASGKHAAVRLSHQPWSC
jgi:hypothetical protein